MYKTRTSRVRVLHTLAPSVPFPPHSTLSHCTSLFAWSGGETKTHALDTDTAPLAVHRPWAPLVCLAPLQPHAAAHPLPPLQLFADPSARLTVPRTGLMTFDFPVAVTRILPVFKYELWMPLFQRSVAYLAVRGVWGKARAETRPDGRQGGRGGSEERLLSVSCSKSLVTPSAPLFDSMQPMALVLTPPSHHHHLVLAQDDRVAVVGDVMSRFKDGCTTGEPIVARMRLGATAYATELEMSSEFASAKHRDAARCVGEAEEPEETAADTKQLLAHHQTAMLQLTTLDDFGRWAQQRGCRFHVWGAPVW